MNDIAIIHHLTNINKKRRTARCSVCGLTRIEVAKPDRQGRVRVYCIKKRRGAVKGSSDGGASKNAWKTQIGSHVIS